MIGGPPRRYGGMDLNSPEFAAAVRAALRDMRVGDAFPPRSIPPGKIAASPRVAKLPASATDGDIVTYRAVPPAGSGVLPASGALWTFQFFANSPSVYRWELIDGGWLIARTNAVETRGVATYGDLSGGVTGPAITLPLAGDYEIHLGCGCLSSAVNGQSLMAPQTSTVAAADVNCVGHTSSTANAMGTPSRSDLIFTDQAAGETLIAKYNASAVNSAYFRRWIKCRPIRVRAA